MAAAAELNLICSADVVICEKLVTEFEAGHSDINVNMVRLSSGEAYAKVRAEGRNPQTDLWWGGTGDPHLQAAHDGLTAEYRSELLPELQDWPSNRRKPGNPDLSIAARWAGAIIPRSSPRRHRRPSLLGIC